MVIENFIEAYQKQDTFQVDFNYHTKFLFKEDTIAYNYSLIKGTDPLDTILGFSFLLRDSLPLLIYHNDTLLVLDHYFKTYSLFTKDKEIKSRVYRRFAGGFLRTILDPYYLHYLLEKSSFFKINNNKVSSYTLIYAFRDEPEKQMFNDTHFISIKLDPAQFLMHTWKIDAMDDHQYRKLIITEHKNITIMNDIFNISSYLKLYKYRLSKTDEEYHSLNIGETPPYFTLHDRNDEIVDLYSLKGKLTLLDFWYLSCYPCQKAMPHINELYLKYSEKGLNVYGINTIDQEIFNGTVQDFLNRNEIEYPILTGDKTTDEAFKVWAYPTLILIDENIKIKYISSGLTPENIKELEQLIESELQ